MKNLEQYRSKINEIDEEMAGLFCERMKCAKKIGEYKKEHHLPVFDESREAFLIEKNSYYVQEKELKSYYVDFLKDTMEVSKRYQRALFEDPDVIHMNLKENGYDIVVKHFALDEVERLLNLERKVLIVTDDGVPLSYAKKVEEKAKQGWIEVLAQGESSKNFTNYERLLKRMLKEGFTRGDCVVAVGGGVVGDLAGFAASTYMRGIDFYNIPTTLLSQIDSSIGGKTAIDFEEVKNIVGAFYQPAKVIVDPEVLKTLDDRQIAAGLAEAVKMALTFDADLFRLFETEDVEEQLDEIIRRSLEIKKWVVEQDEKEGGLRRVLNFGHTLGHGIESEKEGSLYHGECVALGMIPMCEEKIRERLVNVLKKLGLLVTVSFSMEKVMEAVKYDKKATEDKLRIIKVKSIGSYEICEAEEEELKTLLSVLKEK